MAGWRMHDLYVPKLVTLPPFQLDDTGEAQVTHEVPHVSWHDDYRTLPGLAAREVSDGSQRWPMQVIEMRV